MAILTADDIRFRKFSTTRFREGYDLDEVDDFLEEVIQTFDELSRLAQAGSMPFPASSSSMPVIGDPNNNPVVLGLRAENSQLQQKVAILESQIGSTPTPQLVDTAELTQLREDNQELASRLRDAEQRLQNVGNSSSGTSSIEAERLAGQLEALQRDYNEIIDENRDLEAEIDKLQGETTSRDSSAETGKIDALKVELEHVRDQLDESNSHVARLQIKLQAAESRGPDTGSINAISDAATAAGGGAGQAAAMLNMAQQLHDEYVQKGKNESNRLIEEAMSQRDKLINTATDDHDRLITEAHEENKRIISEAKEAADQTYETLAKERGNIERKIDELRLFEKDYRARLKTFLENLLDDVDRRESLPKVGEVEKPKARVPRESTRETPRESTRESTRESARESTREEAERDEPRRTARISDDTSSDTVVMARTDVRDDEDLAPTNGDETNRL